MSSSLAPGTRLGPYEIVASVGAGGMGQVYRAVDTRLDRAVAIKILPAEYRADPALRQRFDREARTIAALNHPHICVLHDIGDQDGIAFLVMEYLEGETLGARISRGPLPIEEVFDYSIQMADALDRAHRHGVIHRDLKPANVMLTRTGAKLLDFGLARPPAEHLFSSETHPPGDTPITAEGALVGTLQYMAPEQLEGRAVDARTDLFALGAVMYEMATGERAFPGDSQASIIASILNRTPPPPSLRQHVSPPALDHIVARALAKDPEDRWQTSRDLLLELRTRRAERPAIVRSSAMPPIGWLLAALVLLGIAGARTALTLYDRDGHELGPVGEHGIMFDVNISPDGKRVAVNRGEPADIWVYELERGTSLRLTFDPRNETLPVWSPDGHALAYARVEPDGRAAVMQVSSTGGEPTMMLPPGDLTVTDWSRDGKYLLLRQGSLSMGPGDIYEVPTDQLSHARPLLETAFAEYHARFSPDGRWVSYVSNESGRDEVYVMRFQPPAPGVPVPTTAGGRVRISTAGGILPRWRSDGSELFYLAPDLRVMAARIDGTGESVTVDSVAPLFSINPKPSGWAYDTTPDGQRFIVNSLGDEGRRPLVLVTDWTSAVQTSPR